VGGEAGRNNSFVLRIWCEEGETRWRGWARHASTGQVAYVQSAEELLAFIERYTGPLTDQRQEDRDVERRVAERATVDQI